MVRIRFPPEASQLRTRVQSPTQTFRHSSIRISPQKDRCPCSSFCAEQIASIPYSPGPRNWQRDERGDHGEE
jgi:hypothetical protein